MKLINRENGEELVEVGSHKDYASKGVAGAGTVEIKIPFINKAIALDKDDINEFKEMLSKIQQ